MLKLGPPGKELDLVRAETSAIPVGQPMPPASLGPQKMVSHYCCLVSIMCSLWLVVEHRPTCEGDPLYPGHWFSFHPLASLALQVSVSLLLLVALAQLLLCQNDGHLSWEQAGILAHPLGLMSVLGVIILTLFSLLLFLIIVFHPGHSLCFNWFLFCRRSCVMYL